MVFRALGEQNRIRVPQKKKLFITVTSDAQPRSSARGDPHDEQREHGHKRAHMLRLSMTDGDRSEQREQARVGPWRPCKLHLLPDRPDRRSTRCTASRRRIDLSLLVATLDDDCIDTLNSRVDDADVNSTGLRATTTRTSRSRFRASEYFAGTIPPNGNGNGNGNIFLEV